MSSGFECLVSISTKRSYIAFLRAKLPFAGNGTAVSLAKFELGRFHTLVPTIRLRIIQNHQYVYLTQFESTRVQSGEMKKDLPRILIDDFVAYGILAIESTPHHCCPPGKNLVGRACAEVVAKHGIVGSRCEFYLGQDLAVFGTRVDDLPSHTECWFL